MIPPAVADKGRRRHVYRIMDLRWMLADKGAGDRGAEGERKRRVKTHGGAAIEAERGSKSGGVGVLIITSLIN